MLRDDGFELARGVFSQLELDDLGLDSEGAAGVRSLLDRDEVLRFARDERLLRLAGPGAFAVRATLFDKSSAANWALGWHQDSSIAVVERFELEGYGPWTVKDGVVHTIAPISLLESMVSLRIHLDPCGEDNGPLRVVPGSHRLGLLGAAELAHVVERSENQTCPASTGDVLAFKPLLLHASASARVPSHRRVLQLEYAFAPLPMPLRWRWAPSA